MKKSTVNVNPVRYFVSHDKLHGFFTQVTISCLHFLTFEQTLRLGVGG